mgnify:CR=1 FL=1
MRGGLSASQFEGDEAHQGLVGLLPVASERRVLELEEKLDHVLERAGIC